MGRGLNFLRQVFVEADMGHSGNLSRWQYKNAFTDERVTHRLQKLGLAVPDWLTIFDALDLDGNDQLTLNELLQCARTIWEADMENHLKQMVSYHEHQHQHHGNL